ncbi:hypothetical protein [Altererythrobacter sp. MF3-039]|uniref:hypothetical protein n=1 Tax=Altererythrobacter sp. MF3-039 TaxID=3252901 RepID=UPI00390C50C4
MRAIACEGTGARTVIGWLKRRDRLEGGEDKRLGVFTVGVLGLGVTVLGIDIVVTAQTMEADENGYPVRLIIPERLAEVVRRPPPVLMGENVELVSAALAERAETGTPQNLSRRLQPGEFDRAFGITQRGVRTANLTPIPKPGKNGLINVKFDLEGGAKSSNAISVDKPVAIGGAPSGKLAIRIDGAAQIFADRGQIAELVAKNDTAKAEKIRTASGDDYLSFNRLRDLGVDIRYDPSADRIVIPTDG